MTLVQILEAVRDLPHPDPRFREAMLALERVIRDLMPHGRPTRALHTEGLADPHAMCREETVSEVWLELYQQLRDGRFAVATDDPDPPKRRYVANLVQWRVTDCYRRIPPIIELNEEIRGTPAPEPEEMLDHQRAMDLLQSRVYLHARRARVREVDRCSLDRAWEQARLLCVEGASMDEVVQRAYGVEPESSEAERVSARDRVLTGQSRLRKVLRRAVDDLEHRGHTTMSEGVDCLSEDEADLVRRLIGRLLVRRGVRKGSFGTSSRRGSQ